MTQSTIKVKKNTTLKGSIPKGPVYPKRPDPKTFAEWSEYFLMEYRFLFVIPFLLPASFIYQKYWNLRDFFIRTIGN